jgi:hypothetical protein
MAWRLVKATGATMAVLLTLALTLTVAGAPAQDRPASLPVRHQEGLVHGFLTLETLDGKPLADGEQIQNVKGDRVTTRLVFRFFDGSLHDETAVYSQRGSFRLITVRLVQKGPAFPRAMDMTIDTSAGRVTVQYTEDGKQKVDTDEIEAPPNLVNGLIIVTLKNARGAAPPRLSYVAATPKPRAVDFDVRVAGVDTFMTGRTARKATHYVVKVKIGGLTGLLARVLGKLPPDSHIWIMSGEAPAFVKAEYPFYSGGPLWRVGLVSPRWK